MQVICGQYIGTYNEDERLEKISERRRAKTDGMKLHWCGLLVCPLEFQDEM
jgi:hypothetical protein